LNRIELRRLEQYEDNGEEMLCVEFGRLMKRRERVSTRCSDAASRKAILIEHFEERRETDGWSPLDNKGKSDE